MKYELLRFAHILGAILLGAGVIGVWFSDFRSRQLKEFPQFSEVVRNIPIFYDGLIVPGSVLLFASGTWLIIEFWGGWAFVKVPWLLGMVVLYAFELVVGNIVTRPYFLRLHRLAKDLLPKGEFTPQLKETRSEKVPTFTHFLDLPILVLFVALGTITPDTWTFFIVAVIFVLLVAATLTICIPNRYPWAAESD